MDTIKSLLKERKNAHFFLVNGFSKLLTHSVHNIESSIFNVCGLNWKILIYPAGEEDVTEDNLGFQLMIEDTESFVSNWEVKCDLKLSIVSQTRQSDRSMTLPKKCYSKHQQIYGIHYYPKRNEGHGCLVNDQMVFCAEIIDVKPNFTVTIPQRTIGTAERLILTEQPPKNSRFTWKITQFSSFDSDKSHESYEFTFGPRRWVLRMYPTGYGKEKGNSLSMVLRAGDYVTANGPKAKTLAAFKLRLLDQLHCKHIEKRMDPFSFQLNTCYGSDQLVPLEKLKNSSLGFLVNDEIYLGVEFLLVSTSEYINL